MTTIRVSERTREILRGLALEANAPMHEVVDQAVELYRRQRLLAATNAAYAAVRANPAAWEDLQAERTELEGTLADGLEDV